MNYVSIINIIFFAISMLLGIYLFHFAFFAIVGMFAKKKFPSATEKCRYGILVSAKDEENVIPRLITSVRDANYPQDKLDIYIIAHNCKDKTADVARSMGANVIVYNDENARTLGLAYQYAYKHIDIREYDGIIVLNADNVVSKDFFDKMNDAFVYHHKNDPVTSFRHALNMKDGAISAAYSYYFAAGCSLSFKGRELFNTACRVTGCGFLIPIRLLENGWNYTSITEDIEFSADQILNGEKIRYADDAIFYDEQPHNLKTTWFQRLRWAKGQNVVSRKYWVKFLAALFDKNKKNKFSLFVMLTFNSFVALVFFFLFVLQNVLLLLSPLFGISLEETFLYWNNDLSWFQNLFMSFNTGAIFTIAKSIIWFIGTSYLTVIAVLIAARDKYKGQPLAQKITGFLIFPLFIFLQIPLDLAAIFIREVKWKKIPHGINKK